MNIERLFHPSEIIESGVTRGYRWATTRGGFFGINGYVQLPKGHPWLEDPEGLIDAPGGITFSYERWVGFDTAHAGDIWPQSEADRHGLRTLPMSLPNLVPSREWSLEQVLQEIHAIIERAGDAA